MRRHIWSASQLIQIALFGGVGQGLRALGQFGAALPWLQRAVDAVERFMDEALRSVQLDLPVPATA